MSRTRLIRPEFYADSRMASVSVATRYFYIGLWTECDDAGYFELDLAALAVAIYPFDGRARREKATTAALAALVALERVRYLDCGHHAVVPTLPDHRIKGGEPSFVVKKRHDKRCSVALRSPTSDSVSVSVTSSGSVDVSEGAQARDAKEPIDFHAAMAANGFRSYSKAEQIGKAKAR